ncbi:hypothetical protein RSOL_074950, partial [Rhizoctonia solani AG-3 Rhs1AP]
MNGPFSSFGPPQGTPIWYKNSLTNALRTIAQKSKAVLPQDIYAIIEEAAGRVYVYESYIHDMHAVNPDRPIHSDPLYVYTGYKTSLVNLLRVANQPGLEPTPKGRVYRDINVCLQDILALVRVQGNDVGRLFADPEMNRLLVNLANVL